MAPFTYHKIFYGIFALNKSLKPQIMSKQELDKLNEQFDKCVLQSKILFGLFIATSVLGVIVMTSYLIQF